MGERIAFGFAAAGAIGSSVAVITLKDAFRAAIALIGALVSVAVIFVLLAAPFLAAIQIIVYAGAIVVLFLFVIAYLGQKANTTPDRLVRYQVFAWLITVILTGMITVALLNVSLPGYGSDPEPTGPIGEPEAIGNAFLDDYLVVFEATSLVLLVAAVGAVLLAKRAVQLEGGR